MLDALSLDQLRVFVAIADHGSFSAAARELKRAQSAISNAVVNLEDALAVSLYDRSGWKPVLTPHGEALLADARAVLLRTEQFKARAYSLTRGVEAELSMVFDVMYPAQQMVDVIRRLRVAFPSVIVRLRTEVLGAVPDKVLSGECDLGVQATSPGIDDALVTHMLPSIALIPVSAPSYELAGATDIGTETLRRHTQIVLSDNSGRTSNRTFAVFSADRIMTADLGSKQAMLRAGLGWGYMPLNVVEDDLAYGKLVELSLQDTTIQRRRLPFLIIYRHAQPPGPAGQWVVDQLQKVHV
jgi:DNA-binding transcriptional LysR family regulator